MELYYTTDITKENAVLSEDESIHCIRILRHKVGDEIYFTDGNGGFYKSKITNAHPKRCELAIIHKKEKEKRDYHLHIAIAPTKSIDRTEFFVEKSVEIGIDEITFLKCERSERKDVKIERIKKIAVSAMKQSKKAFLPVINPTVSFREFIQQHNISEKYIACLDETHQKGLVDISKKEKEYLMLIGPEGDFSPTEVKSAIGEGFKSLSLGENILRTETAAIFACMYINTFRQIS